MKSCAWCGQEVVQTSVFWNDHWVSGGHLVCDFVLPEDRERFKLFHRDDPTAVHPFHYIYFHGEVEDHIVNQSAEWFPPDLVSGEVPMSSLPDGNYKVEVYGMDATLVLRTNNNKPFTAFREGLVVTDPKLGEEYFVKFRNH